jgi:uncharacterized protein YndB with AHSA1/START domain
VTTINIAKDFDALTMTVSATFDAPVERLWHLWSEPRQLERWWGPPDYPATVVDHDLTPGGAVSYFMTSPEGDRHRGWWKVLAVDAPHGLEFEDGFADDDGNPNLELPVSATRVSLAATADGRTAMTIVSTFPSLEAMEETIAMGVEEGLAGAMGQIDAILAGS